MLYECSLTKSQHLLISSTQEPHIVKHLCEESSGVRTSAEAEEVNRIAVVVISHQELFAQFRFRSQDGGLTLYPAMTCSPKLVPTAWSFALVSEGHISTDAMLSYSRLTP